ncbi:MAG: hypothetical protein LQ345_006313 [Seirophora villosa]|nr:MAG: hypothetical protein LQ345_006313 [Seirophora villosa]
MLRAETLARDLCQPVYEANPSLELSASSAIASATAAAMSALATRDPTVLTDYPLCVTSNVAPVFPNRFAWVIQSVPVIVQQSPTPKLLAKLPIVRKRTWIP